MSLNAYASLGNLPDDYNQLNDPGNSWDDEEEDFDEEYDEDLSSVRLPGPPSWEDDEDLDDQW